MPNDDDVTEITSLKALMKLENLLIKSEFQVDSIRWCVICDIHPKFCMSLGVWQGQFSVAFYFNIDFFFLYRKMETDFIFYLFSFYYLLQ